VVGNGFLFTRKGKPITPDVLSQDWRKAADAAGYPNLELYEAVKHSMASIVARESEAAGIKAAAERIGVTAEVASRHYVMRGEVAPIKRTSDEI